MRTAAAIGPTGPWTIVRHRFGSLHPHLGLICAWTAMIIYASSNSIVTLLVAIGEAAPVVEGRNAITYTNLLLLGSLISIVPMSIMFRRDLTRSNFRRLTRRNWGLVALSALLSSAITPGLFFFALANTSVTNIVLISRIEPPLFLLAAWLFLNERFPPRAMAAGMVALSGAVVMIALRGGAGVNALGIGEWATVGATLSYIASTLVTRTSLRNIPIGLFSVARTILGSVIYFALVCMIVGLEAFRDIFAPVLWSWIWLYAGIVIVLAQVTWNLALKYARSDTLSLATSFSPLAAIVIAMILLGEEVGPGFLPGAILIMFAIFLSRRTSQANGRASKATQREFDNRLRPLVAPTFLEVPAARLARFLRHVSKPNKHETVSRQ